MDSLKLIPSIFFDAIARVVPGTAAIFAYLVLFHDSWSGLLGRYLGSPFAQDDALLTATLLFFFAAYIVGQLISPFAKLVQRIGELKLFAPKPKHSKGAYDWLRVNVKEAGEQCAKIRAEFTMHDGLAVVFLASAALYPFRTPHWSWAVLGVLLSATLVTAVRGRTTRDTFNQTVQKLADGAGYKAPAK